jgi:hypothetical protein
MKNRYWFLPLYLPFLLLAVIGIPTAILNYTGMCVSEGKWLSDEELAVRAIERHSVRDKNGYPLITEEQIRNYVQQHPECCKISRDENEIREIRKKGLLPTYASDGLPTPEFIERFWGHYRGFVFVGGLHVEKVNASPTALEGILLNITNCGYAYFLD